MWLPPFVSFVQPGSSAQLRISTILNSVAQDLRGSTQPTVFFSGCDVVRSVGRNFRAAARHGHQHLRQLEQQQKGQSRHWRLSFAAPAGMPHRRPRPRLPGRAGSIKRQTLPRQTFRTPRMLPLPRSCETSLDGLLWTSGTFVLLAPTPRFLQYLAKHQRVGMKCRTWALR